MKPRKLQMLLAVMAVCLIVGGASSTFAAGGNKPCSADLKKFCADVKPGDGRIMACLDQHKQELSPGCNARLAKLTEEAKEVGSACYDDIMLYCSVIKPGKGKLIQCLEKQRSYGPSGRLSGSCDQKLKQLQKEAK